jgi:hypothetical protein
MVATLQLTSELDKGSNTREELIVNLSGMDKVWAFKKNLHVPISHIECIQTAETSFTEDKRLIKVVGAGIGHYKVGTFLELGDTKKMIFLDVHHKEAVKGGKFIAIKLHDERYKELIFEVGCDSDMAIQELSRRVLVLDE